MRSGSKCARLDHNLGKIHDAGEATFELTWLGDDGRTPSRTETLDDPRRGVPQGRASARTSPTSSSPACPACRRKAATASSSRARFVLHRMPPAIRTVCLEFFGQARDSTPAIVEIKRFLDAAADGRHPRAFSSRASSISTRAT